MVRKFTRRGVLTLASGAAVMGLGPPAKSAPSLKAPVRKRAARFQRQPTPPSTLLSCL